LIFVILSCYRIYNNNNIIIIKSLLIYNNNDNNNNNLIIKINISFEILRILLFIYKCIKCDNELYYYYVIKLFIILLFTY